MDIVGILWIAILIGSAINLVSLGTVYLVSKPWREYGDNKEYWWDAFVFIVTMVFSWLATAVLVYCIMKMGDEEYTSD